MQRSSDAYLWHPHVILFTTSYPAYEILPGPRVCTAIALEPPPCQQFIDIPALILFHGHVEKSHCWRSFFLAASRSF